MGRSAGSICLFSSKREAISRAGGVATAGGRKTLEDKGRHPPTDLVHHRRKQRNGRKKAFVSMIHINFVMREEAI